MVTHEQILGVLRGINDPEMPISIVDLGIVEKIRIAPSDRLECAAEAASGAAGVTAARRATGSLPLGATGSLLPVSARACGPSVSARAGEPPVAPVEARAEPEAFGNGAARVCIDILPTFVGCPALPMIEREIREKVGAMPGVAAVEVRFRFDPPWSVERISEAGRAALNLHGVTVPRFVQVFTARMPTATVRCPFCHSDSTRMESAYGPTRCRMIYYCESCRNSFEHLKRV